MATKSLTNTLGGLTLHVQDIHKSLDFYSRIPGAQVVIPIRENGDHQFAMVRIGKGRIGLLAGVPHRQFHIEIDTEDLDDMYKSLKNRGFEPEGPPEVRSWGQKDMQLIDPDGYMIEFDQ